MTAELLDAAPDPIGCDDGQPSARPARPIRESNAVLSDMLVSAAAGDVEAFMHFYDASCGSVHRLEVCRLGDLAAAGEATVARYLTAWQRARECPTSGLSPVAWLLTLPTEQGRPQVVEKEKQVHDVNEGAARE